MPTLLLQGPGCFPAQGGCCPSVPRRSVGSCLCPWGGQGVERQGVPQLLPHVSPSLSQFTADLHKHPEILNVSDSDVLHNFLNGNFSLPNASVLLQQLDTIDNAACGWVHFMAKVRLCPPVGMWVLEQHPPPATGLCGAEEGTGALEEAVASAVSGALGWMSAVEVPIHCWVRGLAGWLWVAHAALCAWSAC